MKGFFGCFDDTIFQISETPETNTYSLVTPDARNEVRLTDDPRDKHSHIEVNISNVAENMISNRDQIDNLITKIQEDKITKINKLGPVYRLCLDYQVVDIRSNQVLDEAIISKNVDAMNATLPLGLDAETNELIFRIAKNIKETFTLVFSTQVPYGIMSKISSGVAVYINRIQLQQCDDFVNSSVTQQIDVIPCKPKYLLQPNRCDHRPDIRRNPHSRASHRVAVHYTVIYDTAAEGYEFNPITINYSPRKISIDIDMLLNNYVITANEDDILSYVADNIDIVTPETPVEPTEPETPDEGDNNTGGTDDGTTETPDDSGSGDNVDSGDITGGDDSGDGTTTPDTDSGNTGTDTNVDVTPEDNTDTTTPEETTNTDDVETPSDTTGE